jgi:hypothetical protein
MAVFWHIMTHHDSATLMMGAAVYLKHWYTIVSLHDFAYNMTELYIEIDQEKLELQSCISFTLVNILFLPSVLITSQWFCSYYALDSMP